MRYNVADLLKSPTGRTRVVDIDEEFSIGDGDVQLVQPVEGRLTFTRDHAGILVTGRLETTVRLPCVRCLQTVDTPIAFELEEEFLPTVYIPGGPDLTPKDEREEATEIDHHHVLDLSEVVRQGLEVSLPVHVLCMEECKGLCPQCGANLNEGDCDCEPPADPRWAALREILDDE